MPSASVDPERLLAAASSLSPLRERCALAVEELLGHLPVAGEHDLQRALDALIDQAADALRAIEAEAHEQSLTLRTVAQECARTERSVTARVPDGARAGTRGAARQ